MKFRLLFSFTLFLLFASGNAAGNEKYGFTCTVDFCVQNESEWKNQQSQERLAKAIEENTPDTGSKRKRAQAFLNLGKAIEEFLGTRHPLVGRMYSRALKYSADSSRKRDREIQKQASILLETWAEERFSAIRLYTSSSNIKYYKSGILVGSIGDLEERNKGHYLLWERKLSGATTKVERLAIKRQYRESQKQLIEAFGFPEIVDIDSGVLTVRNSCRQSQTTCRLNPEGIWFASVRSPGFDLRYEWARSGPKGIDFELERGPRDWTLKNYSWEKDEEVDEYSLSERIATLDRFISFQPEYEEKGRLLADEIMFAHAKREDRLVLFQEYIATFAEPKRKDEALAHIERKYWELAKQEDTLEAFAVFEEKYPNTKYRVDLDTARERLEFVIAKRSGDIGQLLAHVEKYPNGAFKDDAGGEIDRLRFLETRNKNTIASYESFIKAYPESEFRKECEQGIEAIRAGEGFNVARESNTQKAFRTFLKEFPDSAFAPEARAMVASFQAQESKSLADAKKFFGLYHQVHVKNMLKSEYGAILEIVAQHATAQSETRRTDPTQRGVEPFILLHQELWGRDHYLPKLSEFRQKLGETQLLSEIFTNAKDANEQIYALQRFEEERVPNLFNPQLVGQDGSPREDSAGFFGTVTVRTLKPELAYSFTGVPELLGRYTITAQIEMDIRYVRYWQGMVGAPLAAAEDKPKEYTETFVARKSFTVDANRTTSPVWFEFPRIEQSRCKEGAVLTIGSCKKGTPVGQRIKFISIDLAQ